MAVAWQSSSIPSVSGVIQSQQHAVDDEKQTEASLVGPGIQQTGIQQVVKQGEVVPGFGPSRYIICGSEFFLDNKYQPLKCLGAGAYGIVWYVKLKAT